MVEQKKKISKLCLIGFILSIMPIVIMVSGSLCFNNAPRDLRIFLTEKFLPATCITLPVAGFIVSVIGLVTTRRRDRSGRAFGVIGVALPSIAAIIVGTIIGWVLLNSAGSAAKRINNDMYGMGSVGSRGYRNTDLDVSQFRLKEGYDLKNISVSEAELKEYAGSKLQEITDESDRRVKGRYQDYNFLIIRSDNIDKWLELNQPSGFRYDQGYASIAYEQTREVGATRPVPLDVYKDPSDKFIVITDCADHKIISDFFGI